MTDRDIELGRHQRRRERRVDIARNEQHVRPELAQDRFEAFHHPGGLCGVTAGADIEPYVRYAHPEFVEEDLRHRVVVVLARVHERVTDRRRPPRQRSNHRDGLHEVRPGPHHRHDVCDLSHPGRGS